MCQSGGVLMQKRNSNTTPLIASSIRTLESLMTCQPTTRASLQFLLAVLVLHVMPAHGGTCRYFDDFKDNRNGTVTDPRDGLVWQRCAAGQTWTGSDCKGEDLGMSWWNAMQSAKDNRFLSKSDWRLHTAEELKAIVGKHEDCLIGEETKKPWRAVSRAFPAVKSDGYVGSFWSSTTFRSSGAWVVYFFDGGAFSVGRNALTGNVRLVRGGNPVGREEFDREYVNMSSSRYWPGNVRK
jgi:hypothetical protein